MNTAQNKTPFSFLHMIFSLLLPGLGQIIGKKIKRGLIFFTMFLLLGSLSAWSISQKARFPDFSLGLRLFSSLVGQTMLLLFLVILLTWIINRFLVKDLIFQRAIFFLGILIYIILILVFQSNLLGYAGTHEDLTQIHQITAVLAAVSFSGFWFWQAFDAGKIAGIVEDEDLPSIAQSVVLACLVIFVLGYALVGINLHKAIIEHQDINRLLPSVLWPWRNAFEFVEETTEVYQEVQAPCPPGDTGPDSNPQLEGERWVSISPTCGNTSTRDSLGNITFGTELTIDGGGFPPSIPLEIVWRNPIGNPFTPRGYGETDIFTDENGDFSTNLYIPEMVIPDVEATAQIHRVIIRQGSEEIFTGNLSEEMLIALELIIVTIMIGMIATFFGVIMAFPVSFLAARNLMAPLKMPLNDLVGSLLGIVSGFWLAGFLMKYITSAFGGLEEAPIEIFLIGLLLYILAIFFGMRLISSLFIFITAKVGDFFTTLLSAIGLGAIAMAPGYALGLFISRKVVSIPLGEDTAASTESLYALGGMILLGLVAFFIGFLSKGDKEIAIGFIIYSITRTIMNIVRSIEPIIYAIIATIWVGLGAFAGTIALSIHTVAALGKLYSESIESIDPGPVEALQATGASWLQTVIYAVIPQIMPPYISFTIYRWDINIRMSTIIGAVGGGGIGFMLIQWIRQGQYGNAGLAVWLIAMVVGSMDYVSSKIRERFV